MQIPRKALGQEQVGHVGEIEDACSQNKGGML